MSKPFLILLKNVTWETLPVTCYLSNNLEITCVPTCSCPYVPSFFTCLCAYLLTWLYIFFVPTCLRAIIQIISCLVCSHFSRAYVPATTHKIYSGSVLYLAYCCFSPDYLIFHSIQNSKTNPCFQNYIPQPYLMGFCYLKWHMCEENNLRSN